tara:strand:- start:4679 stop:5095 length:417 start_codon:yes stop_codon:yes gene_type:complete
MKGIRGNLHWDGEEGNSNPIFVPEINGTHNMITNQKNGTSIIFKIGESWSIKDDEDLKIKTYEIIPTGRKNKDSERLDKLESLATGYGKGWILRESINGRGMRLHETSQEGAYPTVREAIDNYKPLYIGGIDPYETER